jgi:hypothetical protein
VVNNICSRNNSYEIAFGFDPGSRGYVVDYNLIHGPAETHYGSHNVFTDPGFLNPKAGDFRIRTNSPARDAGTTGGAPTSDFEGTQRPQGSGIDIGAYEVVSGADFAVSCNPASLALLPGATGTTTCTVFSFNAFSGAVDLGCAGQPSLASCVFVPARIAAQPNGFAKAVMRLNVAAGAAPGSYPFQITGNSGFTRQFGFTLTVRR